MIDLKNLTCHVGGIMVSIVAFQKVLCAFIESIPLEKKVTLAEELSSFQF